MIFQCSGLLWVLWVAIGNSVWASDDSNQPYIDQLREQIRHTDQADQDSKKNNRSSDHPSSTPYLDEIQKHLKTETPTDSYIEELKATDPKRDDPQAESYINGLKDQMDTKSSGGAIQAFHEGKSDLEFKRPGNIHNAMGFRYATAPVRTIQGAVGTQAATFNSIYGGIYAPEFSVFYEYQPFHSEWFGNIGILLNVGISYFYGIGQYAIQIPMPGNTGYFPSNSLTKFQFFTVPVSLLLDYRFNLFRILRPYIMAGPTLFGYLESRNDGGAINKGYAEAFTGSLGVSILLDWISKSSSWDLYSDFAVKHYYLTLDYTRVLPFAGDVRFASSGITFGFTFEY